MQHIQQYGRDTILRLLSHIDTIETELKIAIEDEDKVADQYRKESVKVDRLVKNVVQLQRELTAEREGNKEKVPKDVAVALDQIIGFDKYALGWAMFNIMVSRESMLEPFARVIKSHFGTNHLSLANALINDYIIEEPNDHDQRLLIDLAQLINTWDGRSRYTLNKDISELLTDYFQEIAK
jgi:RIO-like serine/threonine protein kinase